jgi:hypothetical protein
MFKKIILSATLLVALASCADSKIINGTEYDSIGVFHDPAPCINYRVVAGNVVWAVILIETVVMPVYFIGFSIQEPVSYDYFRCPLEKETVLS